MLHGFRTDQASACQQTSFAIISHFQTAKYDSAAYYDKIIIIK
jgi:hypothetical protein